MGTGFSKRKKQAKLLQQQLSQMQNQMKETEVTGTAGNGLVSVTLRGDNSMKDIKIKPECVDPEDVEGLQDLIKAAYEDALSKMQQGAPSLPPSFPDLKNLGLNF
ncbi:YbaB/EbfC family nucleoid-associated protein [Parachlamydia sp. AcF125]|uniref:YbaB/EbfC family nucleoid-associated protein n=1 Tax=Parachlamydia sp. AcF125 TaxID=2795736 RepID=UPI001BC8E6F3|nr:YbaB/EbfC family nucleoid-associated protein [Parachlamydia sp. AcF125]MBS4167525.1 Nucleoid-associated protein [Parachlamydia sp. AcF125]